MHRLSLDATSLHPASDAEFLHSFAFAHIGIQLSDPGSEQNLTYKFPLGPSWKVAIRTQTRQEIQKSI